MAKRRSIKEAMEIAVHPMNENKIFYFNYKTTIMGVIRHGKDIYFVKEGGITGAKVTAYDKITYTE